MNMLKFIGSYNIDCKPNNKNMEQRGNSYKVEKLEVGRILILRGLDNNDLYGRRVIAHRKDWNTLLVIMDEVIWEFETL